MEDVLKKRGNCLMVYVPQELDHHFASQITDEVDRELKKGNVRQLVFDFSGTIPMHPIRLLLPAEIPYFSADNKRMCIRLCTPFPSRFLLGYSSPVSSKLSWPSPSPLLSSPLLSSPLLSPLLSSWFPSVFPESNPSSPPPLSWPSSVSPPVSS